MAEEVEEAVARAAGLVAFGVRPRTVVYVNRVPRAPGVPPLADDAFRAEVPALLVFCDEMPGANWMHPCSYALVDPQTRTVLARLPADRPPVFGLLPPTWSVVSDPDGLADLVSRAPPESSPPDNPKRS